MPFLRVDVDILRYCSASGSSERIVVTWHTGSYSASRDAYYRIMDLSAAAASALDALDASTEGGFVEEYEITRNGKRVRRGSPESQVKAALLLNAIAARQSGGLCKLAKLRDDE